jgi:lysophospholipase L1-like esterase
VIYFNFGLHDLKHVDAVTKEASAKAQDPLLTDLPTYATNLTIIAERLKATGAKVIFATTTPVPEHPGSPLREPGMPPKYNEVAIRVMKKQGIEVDDLYGFVLPQVKEIQIPDNVHYTPNGYELLGKHITAVISKYLS